MSADGPEQRALEAQEASERAALDLERREDRAEGLRMALFDIARSHVDAMRVCQHQARSNVFGLDAVRRCVFCGAVMS
jgi:hypothetical protein